ncbi:MAG: sialate O-acetylesterase [Arcicella sp.]|nr:sialate O-acetylesterase [Arcicella sp.]
MKKTLIILSFICFQSFSQEKANQSLKLARLFSDHLVFQRDKPIKIWGWAGVGERVEVSIGNQKNIVSTNSDGKWLAELPAMPAGGPYDVFIKTKTKEIAISDILIGEVWLCSGQSNMEWKLKSADNATNEMAEANYPMIRHFEVAHEVEFEPQDDLKSGEWKVCSPKTAGDFSAVGYFFARDLYQKLKVPIGLIHSSWGGSQVEGWISKKAMKESDVLNYYPNIMPKNWNEDTDNWKRKLVEKIYGDKNYNLNSVKASEYLKEGFNFNKWLRVDLGSSFDWQNIGAFRGNYFLQRTIEIPESAVSEESIFIFGRNNSKMELYINGNIIFSGTNEKNIAIKVPQNKWKKGTNSIIIKIGTTTNPPWFGAGIEGKSDEFYIESSQGNIPLNNQKWNMCPVWDEPITFAHFMNSVGTTIYNAMIAPLIPYGIQGTIWYQGESNAGRAFQYRKSFPLMIQNWRKDWKDDFSFLFAQLSSYGKNQSSNEGSNWAELREAQNMTLSLPKTGMAVITDIGNPDNIHPTNKLDVGKRLALSALKMTYNQSNTIISPMFKEVKFVGNKAIVSFENVGSTLMTKDKYGYLKGFEIAGDDKRFYYAQAQIKNNTVVISHSNVNKPVSVRYAWADAPIDANLFNTEGLPASPFRTDTWEGITTKKQYEQ